jgi:hypothetical protein
MDPLPHRSRTFKGLVEMDLRRTMPWRTTTFTPWKEAFRSAGRETIAAQVVQT